MFFFLNDPVSLNKASLKVITIENNLYLIIYTYLSSGPYLFSAAALQPGRKENNLIPPFISSQC